MFFNSFIIFVTVTVIGYEASRINTLSNCGSNALRCGDGRCVPVDEGCSGTDASNLLNALRSPDFKSIESDRILQTYLDHHNRNPMQDTTKICNLPLYPMNGRYSIAALNKWLPSEPTNLALEYECDEGFVLVGTATPRCINGDWKDELPRCSAACKLEKRANFHYRCPNKYNKDFCQEYVPVGSVVRVSRHQDTSSEPVAVSIACLDDGTFNITVACVQELDQRHHEFEEPAIRKIIDYESKFGKMSSNDVDPEFLHLVNDYHSFEKRVYDYLREMNQKADECDIYLDLLLPDDSLTLVLE